jgi:hypothetical protein
MTDAIDIRQAFNALNKVLTPADADATDVLGAINKLTASLTTFAAANTGTQTIALTGDVTGSGTGTFAATIGSNKVTAAKIASGAFKFLAFDGVDASGSAALATLTGAVVGDVIIGVVNLTDGSAASSYFEGVISTIGKINQLNTNLSTKKFAAMLIAKGA